MEKSNIFRRVFLFYYKGYIGMIVDKTLWAMIIIKFIIMFLAHKFFHFSSSLKSNIIIPKSVASTQLKFLQIQTSSL